MALHDPSDEQLIEAIRARGSHAFDVLYARYAQAIERYIGGITHDGDSARDLTQELFLRVWTRCDQWDGRGSLKSWLFRIASNLALNHIRTVQRRREKPLEIPSEDDSIIPGWMIDASALGPEEALELSERRKLIRGLVEELPEDKREVLRLVHEAEMNIHQTAEVLGVPEGTVKSRLHYARKRLAHELGKIDEWEGM